MKLFEVSYIENGDIISILVVEKDKEDVYKKATKYLDENAIYGYSCLSIIQVNAVDGYKIRLEKEWWKDIS